MSEDYKKIALEDVKKWQRIRIVEQYPAYNLMYEGVVVRKDTDHNTVDLGNEAGDIVTIFVDDLYDYYMLLLDDAPKPKVVRTETVTVTHYDDGTKTETLVKDGWTPTVIDTSEQFEAYEEHLKKTLLRDKDGDYWKYSDGHWCWTTSHGTWHDNTDTSFIEASIPLTVVGKIVD